MTPERTATPRSDRRAKQSWARARDLFNTYACTADPAIRDSMDRAFRKALDAAYAACPDGIDLYVDGSWNRDRNAAGIGVAVVTDPSTDPWEAPNRMMGKPVRASGSAEAEVYAIAIGISYVLDTYPWIKSVRLRYDCMASPVCAANVDAYTDRGAPYTNLRSAMHRARKAGVTVLFEHVKAHAASRPNSACDALARHYAKASMARDQRHMADAALSSMRAGSAGNRKEA